MEETGEELPNFSIGIDILGPDPTSSKNKAELKKKLASCAFRKAKKAKFPFLLLFLNLLCTLLSLDNPTEAGKFLSQ